MTDAAGVLLLLGRILFAAFFVVSMLGHLTRGEMMVGYARSKRFPLAAFAGWPAGAWLALGALSIVLGVWPDIGALLLALFVALAAFGIHNFWTLTDPGQRQTERFSFFRNLTYLGAALALLAFFVSVGDKLKFTITGPLFRF